MVREIRKARPADSSSTSTGGEADSAVLYSSTLYALLTTATIHSSKSLLLLDWRASGCLMADSGSEEQGKVGLLHCR